MCWWVNNTLEPIQNTVVSQKKFHDQLVTDLSNRGPLKVLNETKLILSESE